MGTAEEKRGRVQAVTRAAAREAALVAAVAAAIAGATALLLLTIGFPVLPGLAALWTGSFGSWYAFTSATLVRAVPLMLTGSAVALAFRGGVLNIGGEGQLLVGAAAAAGVALTMPAAAGWPSPSGSRPHCRRRRSVARSGQPWRPTCGCATACSK